MFNGPLSSTTPRMSGHAQARIDEDSFSSHFNVDRGAA
jgi:hypothetical protein